VLCGIGLPLAFAQRPVLSPDTRRFLREHVHLTDPQIDTIAAGSATAQEHTTPDRAEILVYGAVYVDADPVEFARRYAEVEKLPDGKTYLAAKYFKSSPSLNDLHFLQLPQEDLAELKDCRPGDCDIQLSRDAIERFRSLNWKSPDSVTKANGLMREIALGALTAYQKGGNKALGEYHDKEKPTAVAQTFQTVLSRGEDLPNAMPDFYSYLKTYPAQKPKDTWEFFYWENVKFGLKPTFRINHVIFHQRKGKPAEWVIANKQIYASHYFQTALDLWFCVRDPYSKSKTGYYLVTLKGSRQEGLTGFSGRILRGIVISKTKDAMVQALLRMKQRAETGK
jgi:hypothetical protein